MNRTDPYTGVVGLTWFIDEAFKGVRSGSILTLRTQLQSSMCGVGLISFGARWQIW
ncbi:unnamed protein product, partial [Rotaria sordida]